MTLAIENVCFDYKEKEHTFRALHDVTLRIADGEFVAIIGPSGSGKTTLMNLVGLLARPTTGRVTVDGIDTSALSEEKRARLRNEYLGFVFQRFELFGRYTALENVIEPLTYRSWSTPRELARGRHRAYQTLHELGLAGKHGNRPGELSGGQKQRVAIARALVTEPRLILADEPTGALDSHTSREVMEKLVALNRAGHTVVVVTHAPDVAAYAHRIISIHDGRIASDEVKTQTLCRDACATPASPEIQVPLQTSALSALLWRRIQPLRASLTNLRRNLVRSSLTSIGLLIGIFALVVFTGLGGSVENALQESFSKPESQILRARWSWWDSSRAGLNTQWPGVATGAPWDALAREFSASGELLPEYFAQNCTVRSTLGKGAQQSIETVSSLHKQTSLLPLQGRLMNRGDLVERSGVALLNESMLGTLFATDDPARRQPGFPLGALIHVEGCASGLTLRVIGVLKSRGGEDLNNKRLLIPFNTFLPASTTAIRVQDFQFIPHDISRLKAMVPELEKRLTSRFNTKFWVDSPVTRGASQLRLLKGFRYTVSALGLLALLVGGVGVLNIMVVTVAERVREIGVMKSLGATPATIRNRFLLESVALCFSAAMVGLVLGIATNVIIVSVLRGMVETITFSYGVLWSPQVFVLALAMGLGCGVLFGYFPARRAGRLDPVECLKSR